MHHIMTEAHDVGAVHQGRDLARDDTGFNLFDHLGRCATWPGPDHALPCVSPPNACLRTGLYLDDHQGGMHDGNTFAGVESRASSCMAGAT